MAAVEAATADWNIRNRHRRPEEKARRTHHHSPPEARCYSFREGDYRSLEGGRCSLEGDCCCCCSRLEGGWYSHPGHNMRLVAGRSPKVDSERVGVAQKGGRS